MENLAADSHQRRIEVDSDYSFCETSFVQGSASGSDDNLSNMRPFLQNAAQAEQESGQSSTRERPLATASDEALPNSINRIFSQLMSGMQVRNRR